MHLVEGFLIRELSEALLGILQSCENYEYIKGGLLLYGDNRELVMCLDRKYLRYLWEYRVELELDEDTIRFLDKLLRATDR